MHLFERYFRMLRLFLPKNERDDIIGELSEEIRSQVAEQEAALGRSLNADEQAAILRQYGHPLLTAARYRPQRYLVGPVVFPYYWLVLKLTIALIVAGHGIGVMMMLAEGAPLSSVGQVFENMVATVLKVLGWTTVVAAGVEVWLTRSKVLENWSPSVAFRPVERLAEPPTVARFVVGVVLSVWWLLGLKFPYLFFGRGADNVTWGTAMDRLYPLLVVVQLIAIAVQFVRLTRPQDMRFLRVARGVGFIAGWAFLYLVATSDHQWMIWHGAAEASARAKIIKEIAGRPVSLIDFVNYTFSIIFLLAAAAGVAGAARTLFRWLSGRRPATVHA